MVRRTAEPWSRTRDSPGKSIDTTEYRHRPLASLPGERSDGRREERERERATKPTEEQLPQRPSAMSAYHEESSFARQSYPAGNAPAEPILCMDSESDKVRVFPFRLPFCFADASLQSERFLTASSSPPRSLMPVQLLFSRRTEETIDAAGAIFPRKDTYAHSSRVSEENPTPK